MKAHIQHRISQEQDYSNPKPVTEKDRDISDKEDEYFPVQEKLISYVLSCTVIVKLMHLQHKNKI